ncbi:MAG: glycosyltransferase family A protein [Rhodothermales bacterium]
MLTTTLAPRVKTEPAIKAPAVDDVTVIMPFYDRIKYLSHYLQEGFYEGLKLQVVCDGSTNDLIEKVSHVFKSEEHVNIHSYVQNKGVAFARSTGINLVKTPYLSFCDDDDFMPKASPFLQKASHKMDENEKILFTAMPHIYSFDESLNYRLQYDRSGFHGKTGKEVLTFLVKTGEMCVLSLGSVFRTDDLKGIEPDDFFKVSEDYVFLARLCARFPNRKVHVEQSGVYMRLAQENSLSAKSSYSLDKIVMHLVSMFVGAYYLFKMSHLRTSAFQHLLIERGKVLQQSYGKGGEAAKMIADMLQGKKISNPTPEQKKAFAFLKSQKANLPAEFLWLVGWIPASRSFTKGLE